MVHVHYDIFFWVYSISRITHIHVLPVKRWIRYGGSSIHFHREEYICPFGFPTMGRIIETDIPGFDPEHVKVV